MAKLQFKGEEGFKLFSIDISHPDAILFGEKWIGKPSSYINKKLDALGFKNLEKMEYDYFNTLFCDEIYTTFKFTYDCLSGLEFSPLFLNDNELIWPKK